MGNKLLKVVLGIIVIYASAIIATYALMRQPPERFAKTISKLPGPVVFTVIPFKPL